MPYSCKTTPMCQAHQHTEIGYLEHSCLSNCKSGGAPQRALDLLEAGGQDIRTGPTKDAGDSPVPLPCQQSPANGMCRDGAAAKSLQAKVVYEARGSEGCARRLDVFLCIRWEPPENELKSRMGWEERLGEPGLLGWLGTWHPGAPSQSVWVQNSGCLVLQCNPNK